MRTRIVVEDVKWRAMGRRWCAVSACLALMALAACSDSPSQASSRVNGRADGILSAVEVSQGPHSTLSAVVEAETSEEAVVSVALSAGEGSPTDPPPSRRGTHHRVPVVGMRAETTYTMTITAEGGDGADDSTSVDWTTGALPDDLPHVKVDSADSEAMAPGVTMFNAMSWGPDADSGDDSADEAGKPGYLVAVDNGGKVVWYYETGPMFTEVSQTAQGTLLVSVNDTTIREIDVLGDTVRELSSRVAVDLGTDVAGQPLTTADSEPIDIDSTHHEIYQLESGNLITLSTEVIQLDHADAEALCPDDPETDVIADVVVELSPDGEVVQEWPLTDVFNPVDRPGAEMCIEQPPIAPPSWFYPQANGTRDWTHANAVVVEPAANRLLVSLRHLDAVVALRYHDDAEGPAGELLWELGPESSLKMMGAGQWFYHQHAIEPHADGTLLLYDNGNHRPGTSADGSRGKPPYSRAVLYQVDEEAGTVTQLWEHRDEAADGDPIYAAFLSDADRLGNGNVLITHGGAREDDDTLYARVIEVVPGDQADGSDDQVVFDMTVGGDDDGWTIYRSDRLTSLYGTGEPAG